MTYEFKEGERVLFHAPDLLTTFATFIRMDEGWPLIRFSDHLPHRPSEATTRPSSVFPLGDEAADKVVTELFKALAKGEEWRIEVLEHILAEIKEAIHADQ